jgi:hypothetical protein
MKWLLKDGDVWLLVFLIVAGAIPMCGDVFRHRPLGTEATIGGIVVTASLVGLGRRIWIHLRAEALRRRMMR